MILPRAGESFEWRGTRTAPALVCAPLDEIGPHLFTTRAWRLGRDRAEREVAWAEVAAGMEASATGFVRLTQVHGCATVVADGLVPDSSVAPPEADIVVSSRIGPAIAVQAADCVPLLLADRRLGVVAAAHAGWRGLAAGVPRVAVEMLGETFGSNPADVVAAIGPSVGACCYEVGPDVRHAFEIGGFPGRDVARWFRDRPTPTVGNPSMPGLPDELRAGHTYFDCWASATSQLEAAGVPFSQIFCAQLCTASHPEVFCSFRRDGAAAGRIAAAIRPSRRR